ncbi:MAG TPA: VanZ family protein [Pyrinomonadaceae bacterium]|nr:VanZ family protein [Pyrinomonadaceae bacterium]
MDSAHIDSQKTNTFQRLWRYGPLLLWMALISLASTSEFSALNTSRVFRPLILWIFPNLSEEGVAAVHFVTRKLGHFSEYAVLGILSARAFAGSAKDFIQRHWFQIALLLITCYALLDEFHQSFVPGRTASIYDSVIDVVGGLTALLLIRFRHRRRQSLRSRTRVTAEIK